MKIDREDWSQVATALAAPVRHFGAFLRCGLLPYLICLTTIGAVALLQGASSSGPETESAPASLTAFLFFMTGLALLSLLSFAINWRRSLASARRDDGPASLFSVDMRSLAYAVATFRDPKPDDSNSRTAPTRERSWVKASLGLVGTLMLTAIALIGIAVALVTLLIVFKPTQDFLNTVQTAAVAGSFVATVFGHRRWRACTAIAIDIAPQDLPSTSRKLPFLPLATVVWLMFFFLALFLPVPTEAPLITALPAAGAWIGALFLAIAWFAALETRVLLRDLGASGDEPLRMGSRRGHRQFRTPHRPAT